MYRMRSLLVICALAAGVVGCGNEESGPASFASARRIDSLDEIVGGPKSLGRPGDLLLENEFFRAVILTDRPSMGPHISGGSLVDLDLVRNDTRYDGGFGRDQFNEMFPMVSMNAQATAETGGVTIAHEGSSTEAAVVRVHGPGEPFLSVLGILWGMVQMPDMWLTTDFIAEPGLPWLTVETTVSFEDEGPVTGGAPVDYPEGGIDILGAGLETGLVFGDFFLAGGSLEVFAPGIGFDEDGAVFEANQAGINSFLEPFAFPFVVGVGEGISYGLVPDAGELYVPLFTASQTALVGGAVDGNGEAERFEPGSTFTYRRHFLVGHGDVGSVVDQMIDLRGIPAGTVRGHVLERSSLLPLSGISVFVFEPGAEDPYSEWKTDIAPTDVLDDGSFGGRLPVGDWELQVYERGRGRSPRLPVTVSEGDTLDVRLEAARPGTVRVRLVDERGEPIPGKVTVFRTDGASGRHPALGDSFIAGDPETVAFAHDGFTDIPMRPGEYEVVASRGLEYEIAVSDPFRVDERSVHDLELQLVRGIDSEGWISADLHVHSSPSHDSGVSPTDRVRTMACEGVEFFATADHDYISDFAPYVEQLGLEAWVSTAPGVETTTVELGHYLAFPLQQQFLGDVGGALDWTGMLPEEIMTGLRELGRDAGYEPVVFVGHPRDGIFGYFDQYGFDPFSGDVDDPTFRPGLLTLANTLITADAASLDMDGIELFTGKRIDLHRTPLQRELDGFADDDGTDVLDWITRTMEEQEGLSEGVYRLTGELEGQVDDWFTLLNLGFRMTALGNSDTHSLTDTEAGCPRNFVASPTDAPAFIRAQDVADAVRDHRVVASYGPFLTMHVDGAPIGSDVRARDGVVGIDLRAQAPSWMSLDRIELYANGTLIREFDVPPDTPSDLRFETFIDLELDEDTWFVAIATGSEAMSPVFTSVEIPYIPLEEAVTAALQPIEAIGSFLSDPVPFPKIHPITPYALTNPIWVDVDGDGFQAPGIPGWMVPAEP